MSLMAAEVVPGAGNVPVLAVAAGPWVKDHPGRAAMGQGRADGWVLPAPAVGWGHGGGSRMGPPEDSSPSSRQGVSGGLGVPACHTPSLPSFSKLGQKGISRAVL